MRRWDLTSGAAKLELALEALRAAETEATGRWDDQARRDFEETYLVPLEPRVRRALDAIHRLSEVLAKARRECES